MPESPESFEPQVRETVGAHARLPVDIATLSIYDDLFQAGMTSHASVNVMLALEAEFDIEFPEAMLRKATFESIEAICNSIAELKMIGASS
jgi:acyl carrier protein